MARAAVRPAAPVRLGRGGEPPGLISPTGVFACSRARQAPAPGSMLDPHDDTDVPSGSTDGAQMESTSFPVPRLHLSRRCLESHLLAISLAAGVDGPVHCPLPNGHCAWSILPVGEANGPVGGSNGYWRQAALAVFWVQADIAVSGLLLSQPL